MSKQRYNYRQAFNQPQMFQEITDNFSFPSPQFVMDWVVFAGTALLLYFPFGFLTGWFSHIRGLHIAVTYFLIPYAVLQVVKVLELDGKKIYYYVFDYGLYFFKYKLHGYQIYKGNKIKREKDVTVYQKVKEPPYRA